MYFHATVKHRSSNHNVIAYCLLQDLLHTYNTFQIYSTAIKISDRFLFLTFYTVVKSRVEMLNNVNFCKFGT